MAGVNRHAHVMFVRMENEGASETERGPVWTWVEFGQRVRGLRQARGWSQATLAQHLKGLGVNLHQTTIAKMEGGIRPTVVHEVWALAVVFKAPYDLLLPPLDWNPFEEFEDAAAEYERLRERVRQERAATAELRERLTRSEHELQRHSRELFELQTMYPGIEQIGRASCGERPEEA